MKNNESIPTTTGYSFNDIANEECHRLISSEWCEKVNAEAGNISADNIRDTMARCKEYALHKLVEECEYIKGSRIFGISFDINEFAPVPGEVFICVSVTGTAVHPPFKRSAGFVRRGQNTEKK